MGEEGALGIGEMGNDEVGNGDMGNGEVGNGYVGNGHVDPNRIGLYTKQHTSSIAAIRFPPGSDIGCGFRGHGLTNSVQMQTTAK